MIRMRVLSGAEVVFCAWAMPPPAPNAIKNNSMNSLRIILNTDSVCKDTKNHPHCKNIVAPDSAIILYNCVAFRG